MKQTVNKYDFRRAFKTMRLNNFSYDALGKLFEYYEQLEDDTGEEIELDVIAICCDWTEIDLENFNLDYGTDFDDIDDAIEYAVDQGGCAIETDNDDKPNILFLSF